ncbi:MAG: radical SAM protein [Bryobacteraceae bacterium]
MPAPAGSKGLIKPSPSREEDREFSIAAALWRGDMTLQSAEEELRGNSAALDTLSIETNMTCPLRCVYCYLSDRPTARSAELSRLSATIADAADTGVRRFAFVGKEPLSDDRALTLIRMLDGRPDRNRLHVGLVTNGIFADRQFAMLSRLQLDYLDVSLDGLAEHNDRWRGDGSFEKALHAIERFSAMPGATLVVNSVLHSGNMQNLEAFMDTLQDHGGRHFSFAPVLDLNDSVSVAQMCADPRELLGTVVRGLAAYAQSHEMCQIMLDLPVGWTMLALQTGVIRWGGVRRDQNGVSYAQPWDGTRFYIKVQVLPQDTWRWARITHDGEYLGRLRAAASRDYARRSAGNISEMTFTRLFRSSLARSGWVSEEWERALSWATGLSVSAPPALRVLG